MSILPDAHADDESRLEYLRRQGGPRTLESAASDYGTLEQTVGAPNPELRWHLERFNAVASRLRESHKLYTLSNDARAKGLNASQGFAAVGLSTERWEDEQLCLRDFDRLKVSRDRIWDLTHPNDDEKGVALAAADTLQNLATIHRYVASASLVLYLTCTRQHLIPARTSILIN